MRLIDSFQICTGIPKSVEAYTIIYHLYYPLILNLLWLSRQLKKDPIVLVKNIYFYVHKLSMFGNLSCYWVTLRKINCGEKQLDITFVDYLFLASSLQWSLCGQNVYTIITYGCYYFIWQSQTLQSNYIEHKTNKKVTFPRNVHFQPFSAWWSFKMSYIVKQTYEWKLIKSVWPFSGQQARKSWLISFEFFQFFVFLLKRDQV